MLTKTDKPEAVRMDEGKVRMDLIPFDALDAIGRVLTKGLKKYTPRNWEHGMDWSRCQASLMRHFSAFSQGEDIDPETGELHTAHIACNAIYLLCYQLRKKGKDDRVKLRPAKPRVRKTR